MDLTQEVLFLAVGFYLLAKGSDWLVAGSSRLAALAGVRPLVVGLTVVAWGTSAPEVVVSTLGAVDGQPSLAMGNVLGSNVANIGLVMGISALLLPAVMHRGLALRETLWLLGSVALLWWACLDGEVTRVDGGVLLAALSVYNLQLLWEARQLSIGAREDLDAPESWCEARPVLASVLGAAGIAFAAWLTIEGAVALAGRVGIDDRVVGLTVVAVGTSLPELAAGVTGALRGHSDISVGNVVGSNVFNVLGVIGVVSLVRPFGGPGESRVAEDLAENLRLDFPIVIAFSVAALAATGLSGERWGRSKGALLLLAYLAYTVYLFESGRV
jgi:cation:H+ antiporter